MSFWSQGWKVGRVAGTAFALSLVFTVAFAVYAIIRRPSVGTLIPLFTLIAIVGAVILLNRWLEPKS